MVSRLDRLPRTDPETGAVLAVVETPRGSRNKYDYDAGLRCFRLKKTLPQGAVFPFDFGFIPSTKAPDGDPLDVMILMDEAAPMGCAVAVRVIGAIEVEQREEGKDWTRNDRLLGVAAHSRAYADVTSLDGLEPKILDELEAFFANYKRLEGKELRVIGRVGPDAALGLIEDAAL